MPEPLEREIRFDIAPALDALEDLDREFTRMERDLEQGLTDAIEAALNNITIGDVDATPVGEAVTEAVTEATANPAIVEGDAFKVSEATSAAIVEGAATPAVVTGDASDITSEIGNAIENAPTLVVILGDASDITDEIARAIAAADTTIKVDADITEAERAIGSLDDQQFTASFDVESSGIDETSSALDDLQAEANDAALAQQGLAGANEALGFASSAALAGTADLTESVGVLGGKAGPAGLAISVLAGFTGSVVGKANEANTAVERLNVTFGDAADAVNNIDIPGFTGDLGDLAFATGSSGTAMRSAAADIGQLGTSAGFTNGEVAQTTQQIALLASRAVALNPKLGDAGEATSRLRRALATTREQALAPFGISLDRAAVNARAMEIAVDHGRTTISAFDRTTAAAEIASSKFAGTMGEDIAGAADKAEIKLRQLQRTLSSALSKIGEPLVAPLIGVLEAALPIVIDFAKVVGDLALAILPVVETALKAIEAPLHIFATIIQAIPDPILQIAAAFAILLPALGAVQTAVGLLAPALGAMAGPIGLTIVALSALTLALFSFGRSSRDAEAESKAAGEAIFGTAESAQQLHDDLGHLSDRFDDYVKNTADFGDETDTLEKTFKALGISNDDLLKGLTGTDKEFQKFADTVHNEALVAVEDFKTSGQDVTEELKQERENIAAGAEATLRLAVANGTLSQSQVDLAKKTNTLNDGTIDYVSALKDADKAALRHQKALEEQQAQLATSSQAFAELREAVIHGVDVGDAIQEFADHFGVTVDQVKAELDPLAEIVRNAVTSAVGALPTAADAVNKFQSDLSSAFTNVTTVTDQANQRIVAAQQAVAEGTKGAQDELAAALTEGAGKIAAATDAAVAASDPQRFVDNLQEQLKAIRDWRASLETIAGAGLSGVFQALIDLGPVAGGQLASRLAQGIRDGKPEVAQAAEETIGAISAESGAVANLVRTHGDLVVEATKETAQKSSAAWGTDFHLRVTPETEAAAEALRKSDVDKVAGGKADQATVAYSEKFLMRPHTEAELQRAQAEIDASTVPGAAGTLGTSATGQYKGGLGLGPATTGALGEASAAFGTTGEVEGAAGTAGRRIGGFFATGISAGMSSPEAQAAVRAAAQSLVRIASQGVDVIAAIRSPSKLFAEKGREIAAGLALGMDQNAKAVEKSAQNLVGVSVAPFANVAANVPALSPRVAAAATVGGAGGGPVTNNFDVAINVNGAMTPADAKAAAETFASEAELALMRRNVIARVRAV